MNAFLGNPPIFLFFQPYVHPLWILARSPPLRRPFSPPSSKSMSDFCLPSGLISLSLGESIYTLQLLAEGSRGQSPGMQLVPLSSCGALVVKYLSHRGSRLKSLRLHKGAVRPRWLRRATLLLTSSYFSQFLSTVTFAIHSARMQPH